MRDNVDVMSHIDTCAPKNISAKVVGIEEPDIL